MRFQQAGVEKFGQYHNGSFGFCGHFGEDAVDAAGNAQGDERNGDSHRDGRRVNLGGGNETIPYHQSVDGGHQQQPGQPA